MFASFLISWRISAVPISGAKVDIILISHISRRSFDCRLCSKVFSAVPICSNPFRFVQKRCFYPPKKGQPIQLLHAKKCYILHQKC